MKQRHKIKIIKVFKKILIRFAYFIYFLILSFSTLLYIAFSSPWIEYNESGISIVERTTIGTAIRAQQSYFFDKGLFSDNIFKEENINIDSTYYNRYFETENKTAFIYTVPKQKYDKKKLLGIEFGVNKKKPFYSYAGAIVAEAQKGERSSFHQIICKSKSVGIIKPNKPIFENNILSCAEGTKDLSKLIRNQY